MSLWTEEKGNDLAIGRAARMADGVLNEVGEGGTLQYEAALCQNLGAGCTDDLLRSFFRQRPFKTLRCAQKK